VIRAVIYARYSTSMQDARSIDDQVRRCREFAKRHGFEVVTVYSDKAVSGKHDQRAQFQALLTAARARAFDVVIVDDISRLARDLGILWDTVFGLFPSVGVVLWDCQTGIASNSPAAKMVFGSMGLGSEQFIDNVRAQTIRGLTGRVLDGFWPGGCVYGYSTVLEPDPPDPKHVRRLAVIVESEAEVIREIFALFNSGHGYKAIADILNRRGVKAPHDGGKRYKRGRGWGHTSVRSVLKNSRYAGVWVWNTRQCVRVPGKKWRRSIARPKAEHITTKLPHLAIVTRGVFDAAQRRMERVSGARDAQGKHERVGRPFGTGRHQYMVTGLLRCGQCGGSMTVAGAWKRDGIRKVWFGCTAYRARGASICSNSVTISEERVTGALLGALRDVLTDPDFVDMVTQAFERRLKGAKPAATSTKERARDVERRLGNVLDEIEEHGGSPALRKRRAELEAKLAELQAQPEPEPVALPSTRALRSRVQAFLQDVSKGGSIPRRREVLARCLPEPVTMTPDGRRYRARGSVNLLALLSDDDCSAKSVSRVLLTGLAEVPFAFDLPPLRAAA
jgi:DNA invertase Pin-like site-specific DNA recombinase